MDKLENLGTAAKNSTKEFERFGQIYGQGATQPMKWANLDREKKKVKRARNKRAKAARKVNRG